MLDELKKLFVEEVTDLLTKVEEDLLLLEKDKDNNDIIQDIFRAIHTIKGSAGVYNLEKTILVSHNFETIFESIRIGEVAVSNDIISLTLHAKDTLQRLISGETEDVVDDSEIEQLISKLNSIKVIQTSKIKKSQGGKDFKTFYILFEPNIDIGERGIDIETILNDFDEFEHKIFSIKTDAARNDVGKLDKYYEVIVSTDFSLDEIKTIFLFVPNEVTVKQISSHNMFEKTDFVDFYENAVTIVPEAELRIELLINFCSIFEEENIFEFEPSEEEGEEIIIGKEELEKAKDTEDQQIEQIRVPSKKLDDLLNLVSELIIHNSQLSQSAASGDYERVSDLSESISTITNTIKENTLSLRLIPIENIVPPYKRLIRDLSLKFNKKIYFVADGVETLVDKNIIEKLFTPLSHIIRNAIDHGIESPEERLEKGKGETGIIRFIAFFSSTNVFIQIQDDGRGINPEKVKAIAVKMGLVKPTDELTKKEIYDLLFIQGFTTASSLTEISGRGVGMDAIKKSIQELRGDVEIDSEIDLGTSVTIKLPLTLSIVETMHLTAGDMHFLLPVSIINQCVHYDSAEFTKDHENAVFINDEMISIIDMKSVFNLNNDSNDNEENLIVINHGQEKIGLIFDTIEGEYQAVIKPLGAVFREYDYFIGASILADGSVGYVLDSYKLINKIKS